MAKGNQRAEEGYGVDPRMPPRNASLLDESRESSIRHYLWGTVIVVMGLFTLFGMWFLLGG